MHESSSNVEEPAVFNNWSLTQTANLKGRFEPEDENELRQNLLSVKGSKIRCCGAGHSWSPIFPDDDTYLIDMSSFGPVDRDEPKITLVYGYDRDGKPLGLNEVDKTKNGFISTPIGVLIYSSVTTGELADVLLRRGLALPCNVILPGVQYGGVVGTACHGVGQGLKSVSDYVTYVEIMTADGKLVKFVKNQDENLEMSQEYDTDNFSAAQGNLGLLGVVVRMALKVQPTVMVHDVNNFKEYSVGDTLAGNGDKLRKLVEENLSVEIFWFPFNGTKMGLPHIENDGMWEPKDDMLWVKIINQEERSDIGPVDPSILSDKQSKDTMLAKVMSTLSPLILKNPLVTPIYLNIAHAFVSKIQPENSRVMLPQAIHYQGGIEELKVFDMEFAFPVKKDFSNIIQAANHVFDLVKSGFNKTKQTGKLTPEYPLNVTMEMRFMGTSDVLLCPAFKRSDETNVYSDYTCYIEVLSLAPENTDSFGEYIERWKTFCGELANLWMDMDEKPIPHWAKQWQILEEYSGRDIYEYIREVYDYRIGEFKAAMEKYDPSKVFVNDALGKVFYQEHAS